MSIAPVKKISLVGPLAEHDTALTRLQELGAMHILPLAPVEMQVEKRVGRDAEEAYKALRFLAVVAKPRRQVREDADFDVHAFVKDALSLKDKLRSARDRRDALEHRLSQMRAWGDFDFPPLDRLAGQRLWFYKLPLKNRAALQEIDLPWQVVGRDSRFAYVVLLSPDEPDADLLPVPRMHLGAKAGHVLEAELEEAEIEIETLEAERLAFTRFLTLLRENLSEAETAAERAFADSQMLQDENIFAIQGWVPEDRVPDIEDACADLGLAVLIEAPRAEETPPTLLVQPDKNAAGVDLATFYQPAHYRAWDPTRLLIASFAIFFAMIVADAGYGLVIALILLAYWTKMDGSVRARAWRRMGMQLAAATVIFGGMVGSFFGFSPPEGSFMDRLAFLDLNDFDTMMRLSIIIGILHISYANFMTFQSKTTRSRYNNLGWIALLFGGLFLWISDQEGALYTLGIALFLLGLGMIMAYASDRPVNAPIDWLWRVLDGVQGATGLMGMFGDVLSYMRLFALGLASASLAITFNNLAGQVMASGSGLAILGGLLIFMIGHVLNFLLAMMSGVVHGLRLNFIEFYKWGLPEEGVVFRAFARKEVQE
ncbi:MAG: V-type ATP synthase subunit I [Pseudomonadota bacterium]